MYAIIDSGTTNSRLYLVNDGGSVVAFADTKAGVRDTSITGSRQRLRGALRELFFGTIQASGIPAGEIRFAIASGMITSEVGLIELPHLVAPVGPLELSRGIYKCEDDAVLPIGRPVYFIRGVRNHYAQNATICDLPGVDFMRGEEVQCVGVLRQLRPVLPCNIVVLSSHTKVIHIDAQGRIAASQTTLSGQLYEALTQATAIGKSLMPQAEEKPYGYRFEELVDTAFGCVQNDGIVRTLLMPRFMQVLMETSAGERSLFADAAIAADDMKAFGQMRARGLLAGPFILVGHARRCEIYTYLLKKSFGPHCEVRSVSGKEAIGELTVCGVKAVASEIIQGGTEPCSE